MPAFWFLAGRCGCSAWLRCPVRPTSRRCRYWPGRCRAGRGRGPAGRCRGAAGQPGHATPVRQTSRCCRCSPGRRWRAPSRSRSSACLLALKAGAAALPVSLATPHQCARPRGAAAAARPAPPNILPCCRPDVCGDLLAGCLENCTHFPAVCQISNLNHHVFIMQISFTKSLHLRLMHSARLGCRKRTLSVVRAAARP